MQALRAYGHRNSSITHVPLLIDPVVPVSEPGLVQLKTLREHEGLHFLIEQLGLELQAPDPRTTPKVWRYISREGATRVSCMHTAECQTQFACLWGHNNSGQLSYLIK